MAVNREHGERSQQIQDRSLTNPGEEGAKAGTYSPRIQPFVSASFPELTLSLYIYNKHQRGLLWGYVMLLLNPLMSKLWQHAVTSNARHEPQPPEEPPLFCVFWTLASSVLVLWWAINPSSPVRHYSSFSNILLITPLLSFSPLYTCHYRVTGPNQIVTGG